MVGLVTTFFTFEILVATNKNSNISALEIVGGLNFYTHRVKWIYIKESRAKKSITREINKKKKEKLEV